MTHLSSQIPPEGCYCGTARKAARLLSRIYDKHLVAADITIPQFSLLRIVGEGEGVTIATLTERLAMDRTTLVRALKPLERDGLIVARRTQTSTRQLNYSLTEQGRGKVGEAMPFWVAAQQEIETRLGAETARTQRRNTREMIEALV